MPIVYIATHSAVTYSAVTHSAVTYSAVTHSVVTHSVELLCLPFYLYSQEIEREEEMEVGSAQSGFLFFANDQNSLSFRHRQSFSTRSSFAALVY